MKNVWILLILITHVYHSARCKKRETMKKLIVAFRSFANAPKSDSETRSALCNKLLL